MRHRIAGAGGLVAAAACTLAVAAGPASAAQTHQFESTFGTFSGAGSVAIDQSTNDVYVLDYAAGNVQKFDAAGAPSTFSALGSGTLDGSGTPTAAFAFDFSASNVQVAVDSSGTATDGDIYVTDSYNGAVDVFDESGTYAGQLTTAGTDPIGQPCGVAVADDGTVYVGNVSGTIARYAPAAGDVTDADYDAQITGAAGSCSLAVDSGGAVYAGTQYGGGPLTKFAASDFGQTSPAGTTIDPSVTAVALDPSNGDVYADKGNQVAQYASDGTPIATFGAGRLTSSGGIAVTGTGRVYAADTTANNVTIFGPLVTLPDVVTGDASAVRPTTATVSGTVAPNGVPTTYHFEYGTTTAYGSTSPATPGDAGAGTGVVPVTADLTGLLPDTTYHARLVASNGNGTVNGADVTFQTNGPVATIEQPTGITTGAASFRGTVDMQGLPGGGYHFVVQGTDSTYGGVTPTVPVPAGAGPVVVSASIGDLPPGGGYSVRLIVDSPISHTYSDAVGFRTVEAPAFVPTPPPPSFSPVPYGCLAPRLNPVSTTVKRGQVVRITGSDLGVGATVQIGSGITSTVDYSAGGFTITIPDDASGTLPLTVNCGRQSNTIGLSVYRAPSNKVSVKASVKSTTATLSVKVPGAGTVRVGGTNLKAAKSRPKKASTVKLRAKLSVAGTRALRRSKTGALRVSVEVSFTPSGGDSRTTTKRVTFRRARR